MTPLAVLQARERVRRWRRAGGSVGLAVFFLALAPLTAWAQAVEGQVTDRTSGMPMPGMLLFLLDSSGSAVGSAITNENGRYALRGPAPGRYRLRAAAIGFASELSSDLELDSGETLQFPFVFGGQPRRLPPVKVVEARRCVLAPAAGAAVATLWEEVSKALTATRLTSEDARYRYSLRQYIRELDVETRAVRRSRSWEQVVGADGDPYGSLPADSLALHGYVRTTDDGTWYYAPDARTLLSESFARTHCLIPAPAEFGKRGLVGLGFEPVARREVPDVRGVLWLDARTSELRHLEFTYTGLTGNLRDHAFGGRIDFGRGPSGGWLIERWVIRMPRLQRATRYRQSALLELGAAPSLTPVSEEVVAGIIERGGEVLARIPADRAQTAPAFASVEGSAFDSTAGRPLAAADLWLESPGQPVPVGRAITDSAGRFVLAKIPAGSYVLSLTHPRLDTLGASLAPVPLVLERGESLTVAFSTPSAAAVARAVCPGRHSGMGLIRGAVRRERSGPALPGARVTARWLSGRVDSADRGTEGGERVATADEGGFYTLCGLPPGQLIELRAEHALTSGDPVSLTLDSAAVTLVDLLAEAEYAPRRGTAILVGRVSGTGARPLAGAEVRVLPDEATALTGADGSYRLAGLAEGRQLIEVRAIGYTPNRRVTELRSGVADTVNVWLTRTAQVLDTVATKGQRDPFRTGFHARMKRNTGGHFVTAEMIHASGTRRVTELLASVPGIRIRKAGQISVVELTGRGSRTLRGCPVAFLLDGMRYEPSANAGLDGEMGLDDIEAIEVYGSGAAPAQFSRLGASCGLVLLWTRDRSVDEAQKEPYADPTAAPAPAKPAGESPPREPRRVDR